MLAPTISSKRTWMHAAANTQHIPSHTPRNRTTQSQKQKSTDQAEDNKSISSRKRIIQSQNGEFSNQRDLLFYTTPFLFSPVAFMTDIIAVFLITSNILWAIWIITLYLRTKAPFNAAVEKEGHTFDAWFNVNSTIIQKRRKIIYGLVAWPWVIVISDLVYVIVIQVHLLFGTALPPPTRTVVMGVGVTLAGIMALGLVVIEMHIYQHLTISIAKVE